jgi:ATP-dependent DNA helicase RecQ
MLTPIKVLQHYWNYPEFRSGQEDIIQNSLNGADTLGILPTGGGKSVCYQVPAMVMDGMALVISPLIALMKDQAYGLTRRGISAEAVFSGQTKEEVEQIYIQAANGQLKFLFVSPERLQSQLFLDYLDDWKVNLLVVDEAHCISQWGYDFRPPYLQIANIRPLLPDVPVLALTASATPFVQQDIADKLAFKTYKKFFTSFARDNISFSSFKVENKIVKTIEILQKVQGTAIVYCRNRRRTKDLAETLKAQGFSADYYHAGLEQDVRNQKQDDWIQNRTQIIVCTNAFGMGIDKPDVRVVIHYDLCDIPEAYYQEAGRAGRDGQKSYAVILYQDKDVKDLQDGVSLRYPALSVIRSIYTSVCSYLQIAFGEGMEGVYDFEISDLCQQYELNVIEVLSTIKLLEMQQFWRLSESVYLPSRVSVVANKSMILNLEKFHPHLDEVLKCLLRMYGGILNHYVPVSEFQMALSLRVAKDYIEACLNDLHQLGILDYIIAKDKPQLFFLHDRVPEQHLNPNMNEIAILKKRYEERVQFMIEFVTEKTSCRAVNLISYFGEELKSNCEKCDNCLQRKKNKQPIDFESIKNTILHEISLHGRVHIKTFCNRYSTLRQEEVMSTIRYLLDEKKLTLDAAGDLISI